MIKIMRIFLFVMTVCSNVAAAESIDDIDVNDSYYLKDSPIFGSELVYVKRVDRDNDRVKIQHQDGTVDWVAPSSLLSTKQKDLRELADGLGLLGMVDCLGSDDVKKCTDTVRKIRARDTDPEFSPQAQAERRRMETPPKPGYQRDPLTSQDTWVPSSRHPTQAHIYADNKEGSWQADPGYRFVDPNNSLETRWTPFTSHPNQEHVHASTEEGKWEPDNGWEFFAPGSLLVIQKMEKIDGLFTKEKIEKQTKLQPKSIEEDKWKIVAYIIGLLLFNFWAQNQKWELDSKE